MTVPKMNRRALLIIPAAALVWAGTVVPVSAEIVVLSSKRTLSVKSHRIERDSIVLTLRSCGEVTCDKSLIEKILPDEVPYEEPKAPQQSAVAADPAAPTPDPALMPATPYGSIISPIPEADGVDAMLVRALFEVESHYEALARSHKGAMGLMRLLPATAREY